MTINKNLNGSELTLGLEGRLDTTTAPELETVIQNELSDVKELVFDFKNLEYISSAGLRVLLSAQKIMNKNGNMKIINVNDMITEIFEVTGFIDILTVE
ncbi:MAG TPA: anti-sigma factor antagonist [Ruminococcaceae bacterium]|nr:anti-sigma factor antagonist [Oscillospiraceae bacterium]